MSKDRREGDLAEVKVGDMLGARPYGAHGWVFSVVERITPTGQMVLSNGVRLNPHGDEMLGSRVGWHWHPAGPSMIREAWARAWLTRLAEAKLLVVGWAQRGDPDRAAHIDGLFCNLLRALEAPHDLP